MIDRLGWLGGILLATCGIPEAYIAIKSGTSALSYTFLLWWGIGELLVFIYALYKNKQINLKPLLFNYGCNLGLIGVILFCKFF